MIRRVPFDKEMYKFECEKAEIKAILKAKYPSENTLKPEKEIVRTALENPIDSPRLSDLAISARNILLIVNDHTRATPTAKTLPILLREIRCANLNTKIKILVATGLHRATSPEELLHKFGKTMTTREDIAVHEASLEHEMINVGILPSGYELRVNRLVEWADLTVTDGLVEPHFFAGFSGGRKAILPGIASRSSILENHSFGMIQHHRSRTGVLNGNIIHQDMLAAAKLVNLQFNLSVAINNHNRIVAAWSGNYATSHLAGCNFITPCSEKAPIMAGIVITSNGGFPLDQNLYQAVKSISTAVDFAHTDGVIICASACKDGNGGESFVNWFRRYKDPNEILWKMATIAPEDTQPDQWQAQILAKAMQKVHIIMVTDEKVKHDVVSMGMFYCKDIPSALTLARQIKPHHDGIIIIPDGIKVYCRLEDNHSI